MAFIAECPFCRLKLQGVPEERAGASLECPRCHNLFTLAAMVCPPKLRPSKAKVSLPKEKLAEASVAAGVSASVMPPHPSRPIEVEVQADEPSSLPSRRLTELVPELRHGTLPPVERPGSINPLGVSALALGGIALAVASLPYVGAGSLPIAGMGLLLGIAGVVVPSTRPSDRIFPALGLCVCVPVLGALIFWPGILGRSPQDTVANRVEGVQTIQTVGATTDWLDVTKVIPQEQNIQVQILSAAVKPVEPTKEKLVSGKYLAIHLRLTNVSSGRPIDYTSWGEASPALASLKDDTTKNYGRKPLRTANEPTVHVAKATIAAGKSIEDILSFEPPPNTIKYLRLELPAAAFGGQGTLRLQIPREIVYFW